MSKTTHTSYVKSPHLTAVLEDGSISCEAKLEKIKGLIDGKKLSLLKSGDAINSRSDTDVSSNDAVSSTSVAPSNEYDLILNDLNGAKEKELGEIILQSINQSDYMSYDRNSYEIIVDSETIRFTNIKNLISYCVTNNAASLPIGLTLFLEGLLRIKTAVYAIRSGDSIAIKDDLLKIDALREKDRVDSSSVPVNGGDTAVGVNEEGVAAAAEGVTDNPAAVVSETTGRRQVVEEAGKGRKRRRGVDEEEEELTPAAKKFGLEDQALSSLRRSPRLTQQLNNAWDSALVKSTSGKKKRGRK